MTDPDKNNDPTLAQKGVYFSYPQTPSQKDWTPSTDGYYISNYSPYSYFVVQMYGKRITLYEPQILNSGRVSVFVDGALDQAHTPLILDNMTSS